MTNLFNYDLDQQEQFAINVGEVKIQGLVRTHQWFIERYFKDVKQSRTLLDLNKSLVFSLAKVHHLELIDKVLIDLDMNENDETLVRVSLQEKRAFSAKFGVSATSNKEIEIYANGFYRSLFGLAEKTSLSCSYYGNNCFGVNSSVDFRDFLLPFWQVNGDLFSRRKIPDTKLTQVLSGGGVGGEVWKNHKVNYRIVQRQIEDIDKEIDLVGDILKSNTLSQLSHSYRKFLVKNKNTGCFFRLKNTLNEGLVCGNNWFLKTEFFTSVYQRVVSILIASLEVAFGGIFSKEKFVDLPDRVYPNVRGFRIPQKRGLYALSILASIGFPVAILRKLFGKVDVEKNFLGTKPYFHGFVNVGSSFKRWSRVWDCAFMSVGLGVYFNLNVGRIEFNYCVPVTKFNSDNFRTFDVNFALS